MPSPFLVLSVRPFDWAIKCGRVRQAGERRVAASPWLLCRFLPRYPDKLSEQMAYGSC